MHVRLINIVDDLLWANRENLELSMIAASMKESGHHAEIEHYKKEEFIFLQQSMKEAVPGGQGIIIFSIDFFTDEDIIRLIYKYSQLVKEHSGYVTLVTGQRASLNSNEILEDCSFIDYVAIGDPEVTARELAACLEQSLKVEDVRGIAFKKDDRIVVTTSRGNCFDSSLPWAVRDKEVLKQCRIAKMRSSRGCTRRCHFCIDVVANKKWKSRDIEEVVSEMQAIVQQYDIRQFNFLDNSFEDPGSLGKIRIETFIRSLESTELQTYFSCLFRADSFRTPKDKQLLKSLSKAGLSSVLVGFESGNQPDLNFFNKSATVEDNLNFYAMLKEADIHVIPGFIMFQPYSSAESLAANLQFINTIDKSYSFLSFCRSLNVFEGTPIARRLKEEQMLEKRDYKKTINYRFTNQNIKHLADALNNVRTSSEAVSVAVRIEYALNLISRLSKHHYEWSGHNAFRQKVYSISGEYGNCVNSFFLECISMISAGWNEKRFQELLNILEESSRQLPIDKELKMFIKSNTRNPQLKFIL